MSRTRTFAFQLTQTPVAMIEKARNAAAGNGVRFQGDERQGRFAGHGIEGTYAIVEARLTIEISRKPIIMPWSIIESTMRNFFA